MKYIKRGTLGENILKVGDVLRFEDDTNEYTVEAIEDGGYRVLLKHGSTLYDRNIWYVHDYVSHINDAEVVEVLTAKSTEEITNTSRYRTQSGKQLYDVLADDLLTPQEFRGSIKKDVYKYVFRYEEKGGIASLEKAKATIDVLIAYERKLGEID